MNKMSMSHAQATGARTYGKRKQPGDSVVHSSRSYLDSPRLLAQHFENMVRGGPDQASVEAALDPAVLDEFYLRYYVAQNAWARVDQTLRRPEDLAYLRSMVHQRQDQYLEMHPHLLTWVDWLRRCRDRDIMGLASQTARRRISQR